MDRPDPSAELRALVAQLVRTGHTVPPELAYLIPEVTPPPVGATPASSQSETASQRRRRSTPPQTPSPIPPDTAHQEPQQLAPPRHYMSFIDGSNTFANQNMISAEITRIFKSFSGLKEYRWTHMSPADQEWIFDAVLRSFPVPPGYTKEHFRIAFTKLAEKRISDTVYRARTAAVAKLPRPDPSAPPTAEDYIAAKAFPPDWCVPSRWESWCDSFASDASFTKRSAAGKTNRGKQEIRSTSGSKSHSQLRFELKQKYGRDPTVEEWFSATHKHGDKEWSTPEGKVVLDRYTELFDEKYKDIPVDERPAEDKTLWKRVLDERSVGENRKQALGGLSPTFHQESCSAQYSRAMPAYPSQPSQTQFEAGFTQLSQRIDDRMENVKDAIVGEISKLTQVMKERLAPRSSSRRSEEEEEGGEDEDDEEGRFDENPRMRRIREDHEEWDSRRRGKKSSSSREKSKKFSMFRKGT